MRSKLFQKGALAAIVAASLVLVGCGGDSVTGASPSEAGSTLVRVAHLSPDAPPVDVLVNGARVVSGAAFGDATGYLALPAGSARVQVVPAGASTPVVIDATLEDRVRAVAMTSLRGDEITGGTVVFCTLEAARSLTVAHELGHTFGLRHSQHGAEIMYGWFLPHDPPGFSPREALAVRLMLQREPGNRFPDTDPGAAASGERRTSVSVCR
jgi:hypothetical protein